MTPRLRAESTTVSSVDSSGRLVPSDLSLGWVQTHLAGLHPVVDVGNARCEADNGGGGVVDSPILTYTWLSSCADGVDDERRRRTAPQCTGRTTAITCCYV